MLGVFGDFSITIILYIITVHDKSEYLHVPLEKSNLSLFCIWYQGVTVWNVILKSKINSKCCEYVFSKSLKSSLIEGRSHCNVLFYFVNCFMT